MHPPRFTLWRPWRVVCGGGVSSTEREIQSSVCSIDRICYQNSLSSNPLIRVTVRPIRRLTPPPTTTTYLAYPHNPLERQNSITHYSYSAEVTIWGRLLWDVRRRNSAGNRNNCGSPVLEGDEGKGNRPITGRKCHPLMGWHFNPSATTAPLTVSSSWFKIIYDSCCLYVSPVIKCTKSSPIRNQNKLLCRSKWRWCENKNVFSFLSDSHLFYTSWLARLHLENRVKEINSLK